MMHYEKRKKRDNLLEAVSQAGMPVGAVYLSGKLGLAPATAGRMLISLERDGMIRKEGTRGRVITNAGLSYLRDCDERNNRQKSVEYVAHAYDELSRERLLEIMDVRLLLEKKTAELACINGSDDQMGQLEKALLEWKLNLKEGGYGSEQDRRIHLTIAEMSGNGAMYYLCMLLLSRDDAYDQFSLRAENLKTTHNQQHEAIVEAIRARKPQRAQQAMEEHLLQVRKDVEHNYNN